MIKIVLTTFQDSFKATIPKKNHRSCQAEICLVYRILSCVYVPCLVWQALVGRRSSSIAKTKLHDQQIHPGIQFSLNRLAVAELQMFEHALWITQNQPYILTGEHLSCIRSKPAKCHAAIGTLGILCLGWRKTWIWYTKCISNVLETYWKHTACAHTSYCEYLCIYAVAPLWKWIQVISLRPSRRTRAGWYGPNLMLVDTHVCDLLIIPIWPRA